MNIQQKLMRPNQRVKHILLIYPSKYGRTYWLAGRYPFEYLKRNKKIISFVEKRPYQVTSMDIKKADIIYCIRCACMHTKRICMQARRMGKAMVYFVDDNFFIKPNEVTARMQVNVNHARSLLSKVDATIVCSKTLYETVKAYCHNVLLLTAYQQFSVDMQSTTDMSTNQQVTIGHMGSLYREMHFEFVTPAIQQIINKYGERVRFEFIGFRPKGLAGNQNVTFFNYITDYKKFQKFFVSRHWDIGLAPLKDTLFARSKTNNKFREFSAIKVSGIYSDISCYNEWVEHKVTGYIADNKVASWYHAMEELILDEALRKHIATNAYTFARENFSFHRYCKQMMDIFNEVYRCKSKNQNIFRI